TRSVIMTFSARSLSARPAGVAAVPLIGPDVTHPSATSSDSSGEALTTQAPGSAGPVAPAGTSTSAAYGAGLPVASRTARPSGSGRTPSVGAERTRQMFAWYTSPSAIASRTRATAST